MKRLLAQVPLVLSLCAVVVCVLPQLARAAEAPSGITRLTTPVTRATGPIRIDGVLDEPDWGNAERIQDFRLILVREGEEPLEATDARVLIDQDNVYVGIWCGNQTAGAIRSSMAPRDQILDDDHISIHFDTYLDRRRAYIFGVNAHGVQLDGILDGDSPDFSWDAVWSAETQRNDDGWYAEFEIPLRNMRFPAGNDTWGLWFRRAITKDDEVATWPLWRQAEQGDIMLQAADLTGLQGVVGGGGLDVQPYVATSRFESRAFSSTVQQPVTPSPWFGETESNVGLDVRYGLTSTLVGQVTVNPDFSQVEADDIQIDVNQRFPLFFPEKRPFFLEGAEIFNTSIDLVYTRRIADPNGGGKLTGAQGPFRIGAIAAYDRGGGSTAGVGAGPRGTARPGYVGIARATWDVDDNNSLGFLGTYRDNKARTDLLFTQGSPVQVPDATRNAVFSGDTKLRFGQTLFFEGQFAGSSTEIDSLGNYIGGTGALNDYAYDAELRFADGVRELEIYQEYAGPEFRAEAGFLDRVDIRETGFESNFIARPENAWLRSWQPIFDAYAIHDHTGQLEEWWVSPMIDWVFQKNTTAHTMYVRSMERWLSRQYDQNVYIFRMNNWLWRPLDISFRAIVGDGIFYGDTDAESFAGWSERYNIDATIRPTPQLTADVRARRSRFSRGYGGEEIFDVWVMGANITYQFTRELHARVFPQYDTGRERLDADVLIGYVLHPGTVLYAGMNGDFQELDGRQRATQRAFFFKASYRILR